MKIAVKLNNIKELQLLGHYNGPIRTFELPARLIKEKSIIGKHLKRGFNFNIHGIALYTREMAQLLIKESCNYLGLISELGCTNLILHGLVSKGAVHSSDNDPLIEVILDTLSKINEYAQVLGVNCFLENGCYSKSFFGAIYEIPSDSQCHLELARTLAMGTVLDLGHAALSSRWYGQSLSDFLKPYTQASEPPGIIHFSDNLLENDDHLAVGAGKADLTCFKQAISACPDSLLTVENFPSGIQQSLNWLIQNSDDGYKESDADELCKIMEWSLQKQ